MNSPPNLYGSWYSCIVSLKRLDQKGGWILTVNLKKSSGNTSPSSAFPTQLEQFIVIVDHHEVDNSLVTACEELCATSSTQILQE